MSSFSLSLFNIANFILFFFFYAQSQKKGTIAIFEERYLMMRASALSVEFFSSISEQFNLASTTSEPKKKGSTRELAPLSKESEDFAFGLLFDFSHAVGRSGT